MNSIKEILESRKFKDEIFKRTDQNGDASDFQRKFQLLPNMTDREPIEIDHTQSMPEVEKAA